MRVVKVSRLMVETVEERLLLVMELAVDEGERVLVRLVICEVRDARVGRIGVEEIGAVVDGERPRLVSMAVSRSEIIASELTVDSCGVFPFDSDGAGR